MYDKIAGLNNLRRSAWSIYCITVLCLIATSASSACDDKPQPAAAPTPTSPLTSTITHTPTPTGSPTPASTPTAIVGLTVPSPVSASPSEATQEALPVEGIWLLDSLDGRPLIEGSVVTLRVKVDSVGGSDGCNRYGGQTEKGSPFDADGAFSPSGFDRTEMLCLEPEGVMEQADPYHSAFLQGKRYSVVDDRLKIFDNAGTARLVFVRQAAFPERLIDLAGTAWRLLMEGDTEGEARAATLAFLDDRLVTGVTACRAYRATYSTSEGSIRFPSIGMLSFTQSCPEESRRLEGEYTDFLSWAWEYSAYEEGESRRLGIRSSRGKTLTFEPLPPTVGDIADAEWALVAFIELGQHHVSRHTLVVEGTEVTLSFDGKGFSGTSGCNTYTGLARVEDGSITIDEESLSHTGKACEGPEGMMEQEQRFLGLLPHVTRYGVYGDGLFMQAEDVFVLYQAR